MGRGASGARKLTRNDLIRMVMGKDSYALQDEYQRDMDDASRLAREREEISAEWLRLRDALKNEVIVDPNLGRQYSEILGLYTEKGKEISAREKQKYKELNELEKRWDDVTDRIEKADMTAREKQMAVLQATTVSTPTQKSYKGFQLDTGTPYLQRHLQQGTAQIVEMSPKDYIILTATKIFNRSTVESSIRGTDVANVKKYARMMKRGIKFYMPSLNLKDREQEGRHRALAAMLNGYKRIPVLIVPDRRR